MPTLKKRLLKKQFAVILFVHLTAIQSLNLNYNKNNEKKKERKEMMCIFLMSKSLKV